VDRLSIPRPEDYIWLQLITYINLRISFKVTRLFMVSVIGIFMLIEIAGNGMVASTNRNSNLSHMSEGSGPVQKVAPNGNHMTIVSQRSHSDLIRTCSTFREILSENMAHSCDYSMLYYKGQCELYSDLLEQNVTEATLKAGNDLSFCSDPRLDEYIEEHGLSNAPRSSTLIPNGEISIA
jgi:hypothetical protein